MELAFSCGSAINEISDSVRDKEKCSNEREKKTEEKSPKIRHFTIASSTKEYTHGTTAFGIYAVQFQQKCAQYP